MVKFTATKQEYINKPNNVSENITPNHFTTVSATLRFKKSDNVAYKNLPPSSGYAGIKFIIKIDAFAITISSVYG